MVPERRRRGAGKDDVVCRLLRVAAESACGILLLHIGLTVQVLAALYPILHQQPREELNAGRGAVAPDEPGEGALSRRGSDGQHVVELGRAQASTCVL